MLLFGDSLENKEDGLTEIVRKLKDSYTTVLKYSLFIVGRLK